MIKQQEKKPKFKAILVIFQKKFLLVAICQMVLRYPKIFDNLYVNMVKAGEAGGVLELVLDRLVNFRKYSEP